MAQNKINIQIKNPNDFIVYNIGRLYVLLDHYFFNIYKEFELNPAKFNLLMVIKHIGKDEGVSQIDIGENLFVSAANITKLIDALEKKEWVKRAASLKDRRVNLIKITEKGSALLDEVWIKHVEAVNSFLEDFSPEDLGQFDDFLKRFKKELENRADSV